MTDRISEEHRSWNMSRIKGKDTKIEVLVRKKLFAEGFRFRKNDKRYPGHPDVVLPKYKTVIFINGCFWHRHEGRKYATTPKTRTEFWKQKFERNKFNDMKHRNELQEAGWKVVTIWECQLKKSVFEDTMAELIAELRRCEKS